VAHTWPPSSSFSSSTAAGKLFDGRQGPHLAERTYCITPRRAAAMERPLDYVIGYCEQLAAAGVEPLYRDPESPFQPAGAVPVSSDGETQTSTGDTTIFSVPGRECRGSRWAYGLKIARTVGGLGAGGGL
jgi:hypothetical protein